MRWTEQLPNVTTRTSALQLPLSPRLSCNLEHQAPKRDEIPPLSLRHFHPKSCNWMWQDIPEGFSSTDGLHDEIRGTAARTLTAHQPQSTYSGYVCKQELARSGLKYLNPSSCFWLCSHSAIDARIHFLKWPVHPRSVSICLKLHPTSLWIPRTGNLGLTVELALLPTTSEAPASGDLGRRTRSSFGHSPRFEVGAPDWAHAVHSYALFRCVFELVGPLIGMLEIDWYTRIPDRGSIVAAGGLDNPRACRPMVLERKCPAPQHICPCIN